MAEEAARDVREDGVAMLGDVELPVLADDTPCTYGFVVVNARGCRWRIGGRLQAEYDRARKRVGIRCINLGRAVRPDSSAPRDGVGVERAS